MMLDNKKLTQLEKKSIDRIYVSDKGVHSYTLFSYLRVNFIDFSKVVRRLEEYGLISIHDDVLKITDSGVELSLLLKRSSNNREWRIVPSKNIAQKLDPQEKYIPSRKKIKDLS